MTTKRFVVNTRRGNVYFDSLEDALRAVNDYFEKTKIVLSIVEVKGRNRAALKTGGKINENTKTAANRRTYSGSCKYVGV